MESAKLKVGLLLDSMETAAWSYRMIEIIQQSQYAEIVLVILNNTVSEPAEQGLSAKIRRNRGRIMRVAVRKALYLLYQDLIERNIKLPDAEEPRDLGRLLKDVPVLAVTPDRKKWSDYFTAPDIAEIKKLNLDILVRCGFRILRGEVLRCAKYGVWSYHHGDNAVNRGGPPGFWESMESWPETGSILQILDEDLDNGKVLCRSWSCTDDMSVKDNKSNYFWKSLSFMPRKMKELYTKGEKEFFEQVELQNIHPAFYSNRLFMKPGNTELAKLVFGKIAQKTVRLCRNRLFFDQWRIMYHLRDGFSSSLWRYKEIVPPKDRFYADPHIIHKNSKYHIFIEEYIYEAHKGRISVIGMTEDGSYEQPVPVLEKPYHLSYPFVFEHDGEYYMIPETATNRTIELYKCVEFPWKWEQETHLMENIRAADATLVFHEGKWWLFAGMAEIPGASLWDELFLFYSDDFRSGEWKSHPMNPVVSDCRNARPAGRIFEREGRLYRPAQNCSLRYGYGFNINHISEMNERNYREKTVSEVKPGWRGDVKATHTFNRVDQLHVIDAQVRTTREW